MFERIVAVPPDPILGLGERVRADTRPDTLDLTSGVYKDETGNTPVFGCVRIAEQRILDAETTKAYLPIDGPESFRAAVEELVLGAERHDRSIRTAESPGGTGALAVAGALLAQAMGPRTVWVSDPTWPNHDGIFRQAGHQTRSYRYYRSGSRELDPEGMLADLSAASSGDVVVLHGCCHNPTGRDLDLDQWRAVGGVLAERGLLGIVDLAYLGLADGLAEDAAFLHHLLPAVPELLICVSFSKNMGLYRERVGALISVSPDDTVAGAVHSNVKQVVRAMYSNPPAFGGLIAATVLGDPALRAGWEAEVTHLRDRLNRLRAVLAASIADAGLAGFEGMDTERGMFTLTGCTPAQVEWLRVERGIYLLDNGRANVAGLDEAGIVRLVGALVEATRRTRD